eukprot:15621063-Heterocapsa_arctica.AAC.1
MAGQNDAKTQQQIQPQGPGAPGAPPESAPLCFLLSFRIVVAGHVLEIPWLAAAPPYLARGHMAN